MTRSFLIAAILLASFPFVAHAQPVAPEPAPCVDSEDHRSVVCTRQGFDTLVAILIEAERDRDEAKALGEKLTADLARQAERVKALESRRCPAHPEPPSRATWAAIGGAAGIVVSVVLVVALR